MDDRARVLKLFSTAAAWGDTAMDPLADVSLELTLENGRQEEYTVPAAALEAFLRDLGLGSVSAHETLFALSSNGHHVSDCATCDACHHVPLTAVEALRRIGMRPSGIRHLLRGLGVSLMRDDLEVVAARLAAPEGLRGWLHFAVSPKRIWAALFGRRRVDVVDDLRRLSDYERTVALWESPLDTRWELPVRRLGHEAVIHERDHRRREQATSN